LILHVIEVPRSGPVNRPPDACFDSIFFSFPYRRGLRLFLKDLFQEIGDPGGRVRPDLSFLFSKHVE
jgi:hypothetical protein